MLAIFTNYLQIKFYTLSLLSLGTFIHKIKISWTQHFFYFLQKITSMKLKYFPKI